MMLIYCNILFQYGDQNSRFERGSFIKNVHLIAFSNGIDTAIRIMYADLKNISKENNNII